MLHVLSSARGVFEGLNYFRKIGAREKGGGGGISSVLFIFLTTPPIYEVKRAHFICFLVSVLLCGLVLVEVCRVEVYSVLFAVCAFYPVCDMWCCLYPYNAI